MLSWKPLGNNASFYEIAASILQKILIQIAQNTKAQKLLVFVRLMLTNFDQF